MGPKCHKECPYKREEKTDNTDTQRHDMNMEAETGVTQLTHIGMPSQPPGARRDRDKFSARVPRWSMILSSFGLLVCRPVQKIHFCCSNYQVYKNLLQQSEKTNAPS